MNNQGTTKTHALQKVTKTTTTLPDGSVKVVTRTECQQADGTQTVTTQESTFPPGLTVPSDDVELGAAPSSARAGSTGSTQRTGPILPPPAPVVQNSLQIKHDPKNIASISTPLAVEIGNLEKQVEALQERLDYCKTMLATETDPQVRATLAAESTRLEKLIEKKKVEIGWFKSTACCVALVLLILLICLISYSQSI